MDIVRRKPLSHGRIAYVLREQIARRRVVWHVRVSDTDEQYGLWSSWRTKALALQEFDTIEAHEAAGVQS